jgi:hypothetical protein
MLIAIFLIIFTSMQVFLIIEETGRYLRAVEAVWYKNFLFVDVMHLSFTLSLVVYNRMSTTKTLKGRGTSLSFLTSEITSRPRRLTFTASSRQTMTHLTSICMSITKLLARQWSP